jgi:hypothetical protein
MFFKWAQILFLIGLFVAMGLAGWRASRLPTPLVQATVIDHRTMPAHTDLELVPYGNGGGTTQNWTTTPETYWLAVTQGRGVAWVAVSREQSSQSPNGCSIVCDRRNLRDQPQ